MKIPESQLWLLEERTSIAIAQGLEWAATTPPAESDLEALVPVEIQKRGTKRS